MTSDTLRVDQVGEFNLINQLITHKQPSSTILGPGDDAGVVTTGNCVAISTDLLIQDQHFRFDWSSPYEIGRKAIAQNASDIEAMGAIPTAFVIGLGVPKDTPVDHIHQLNAGMWHEAERIHTGIVGGDLVQCQQWVISVTVLGDLAGHQPVCRDGARSGSVVALCGVLGYSAAGYDLLQANTTSFTTLCDYHRVPQPPYGQGMCARNAGVQAMIDISDGLIGDLNHIAQASNVCIDLSTALLQPDYDALADPGDALGVDPWNWILTGGEDHGLAGIFPHDVPPGWRIIGKVTGGDPQVCVDGHRWDGSGGWQSFHQAP